ncbi:MAG: DNA polymerase III subunit delta [Ruminococcus sp.]|nr:DNA polymerase III subunit delta [Ruminococcus sp.]
MPKINSGELTASLKKGQLSRLYYIFGGDVAGVTKMTRLIINTAVGGNEEFALTRFDGRRLDISQLADTAGQFNMMSDYNCILINDYNCEKPYEDMRGRSADDVTKKLLAVLKDIPPQTVIIFNVTGFEVKVQRDFRSGQNIIKDKNKKLADFVAKNGILCEFPVKTSGELSKIITAEVSAQGGKISLQNARELADMCLCDGVIIENEIAKLCSYADGREITREMIHEMVHEQNDTTVYNLANAVVSLNADLAFEAIDELNVGNENRVIVLGAITNAFLDLYRAACALKAGVSAEQVTADFEYRGRAFAVRNAFRDCSGMSIERLRKCIIILRNTTMRLNSTASDPRTAIEQAVVQMLEINDR